jgi:hypothetical protein
LIPLKPDKTTKVSTTKGKTSINSTVR